MARTMTAAEVDAAIARSRRRRAFERRAVWVPAGTAGAAFSALLFMGIVEALVGAAGAGVAALAAVGVAHWGRERE